jgi:hypothetical protein
VNIPDERLPLIIRALEHYAAYLNATQRDDRLFRELAEGMKRKPPEQEQTELVRKKKRAFHPSLLPDVAH